MHAGDARRRRRPGVGALVTMVAVLGAGESPAARGEKRWVPARAWRAIMADLGRHFETVQSPANCGACHPAAEQGRDDEDRVRVAR